MDTKKEAELKAKKAAELKAKKAAAENEPLEGKKLEKATEKAQLEEEKLEDELSDKELEIKKLKAELAAKTAEAMKLEAKKPAKKALRYFLVNPAGAVHEVTREHMIDRLKDPKYRAATTTEIETFLKLPRGIQDVPVSQPWSPEPEAYMEPEGFDETVGTTVAEDE